MPDHQDYLHLLHTAPAKLVESFMPSIRVIVWGFIRTGMFKLRDAEDIVQSVSAELIVRLPSIRAHYSGKASIPTYLSCIVRNICLDLHRHAKPEEYATGGLEQLQDNPDRILNSLAIQEAIKALEEVLLLYADESGRLYILLKVHFRLPLSASEILAAYPRCAGQEAVRLVRQYDQDIAQKTELEAYTLVVPFINRMEGKSINADSCRHWVSVRITEIVTLLNVRLAGGCFEGDDLKTLFEMASIQNSAQGEYI